MLIDCFRYPLVLVFGTFSIGYYALVVRYNVLHVWAPHYDSQGQLWPGVFHITVRSGLTT
jgi:hypothetical protein